MALESTLYRHAKPTAPSRLAAFCADVDENRSTRSPEPSETAPRCRKPLPDLRQAWQAMCESQAQTFLETETDRLTTSLNTLKEQIAEWSARA